MKRICLTMAALLAVALGATEAAAQRRVTGVVTAVGSGEPLGSASVQVVGTTTGAYTDADGRFVLAIPDGAQTLRIRRIGFKQRVVSVAAGETELNVALEKDILQLERQVVTGTNTSVASQNAANAVSSVSGDQLTRAPAPTIDNALQGKIPGAVISQNSGAPGGGTQVQLRGVTSINASSSPVYVVDGVIVSNSAIGTGLNTITNAGARTAISTSQDQEVNRIADLNPDDIESIDVLKGASAGAIYGSKASNGVIIIKTKRGQSGRPAISVTQRFGQFSISNKLGLRCFGSETEALEWYREHFTGDSTATLPAPYEQACNDFEEQFYGGNKLSYETLLSVRGGSAGTTYYVGGLAKRDHAIQRNTFYQKQSLTANIGQTIGSRFTLQANNNFVRTLADRGVHGNDNSPIISPGDIFSYTPTFFDLRRKVDGVYRPNPYISEETNPFQTADIVKNPEEVYRYIGSVNMDFTAYSSPRQTLGLNFTGGVDAFQFNSKLFSPPDAFFEDADGQPGTIVTNKTNSIFANLNLGAKHQWVAALLSATTSVGLRKAHRQNDVIFNQGKTLPAGVTNVDFGVNQALDERQFLVKDFAYFAQEELLLLDERLLLTGGINAERSSVNGDDEKYYIYPKLAASYRLPWLPPMTDELKLRVAYGKAGNQPGYGAKFTTLPIGTYGGLLGARTSAIAGNPDIKPETSQELEGGIDAQFWNGRVAVDISAFRKDVTDIVLFAAVAPSTGFTTKVINGGEFYTTGTEIGLNLIPVQTGSINWVSRTTFANTNNRITQLDVPCFNGGSYFSVRFGAPYVCEGRSLTTVQVNNGCLVVVPPGSACSLANRKVFSFYESAPDFNMGFSNEFNVAGFRLTTLVDWRKGGKAVNLTNLYFDPVYLLSDTLLSQQRLEGFIAGRGTYLEDAGFVKIREVSLSYQLPKVWAGRAFGGLTEDVRLEVSGRNLKTWTDYTGYDPEVSNFGNQNIGRFQDVTPYPPSRSVFFSVSANY